MVVRSFLLFAQVTADPASVVISGKENLLAQSVAKLLIYPNPSAGNITVQYNSNNKGNVYLVVHDVTGRAVFSKTEQAVKGLNTYYLNLLHFAPAVYYLELNNGNEQTREKFIELGISFAFDF